MAQKNCAGLIIIIGIIFCFASSAEEFPSVSGEIYGQAPPGVKSISVNGKPVALAAGRNFRAFVNLKAGEKYLTLKIEYEGLRIIKKYLILRQAQIKKFKVHVPKEKITEVIRPVEKIKKPVEIALPIEKIAAKGKTAKRVLPEKPKVIKYQYVWEFSSGKLLLVSELGGKYFAEIFVPATKEWFDLKNLSRKELKGFIENPVPVFKPFKK